VSTQHTAPASRASTFSGSCGSDCDASVHMAAAHPGTRRATRPAGRHPPGRRSAVAVVIAKTSEQARMRAAPRQEDAWAEGRQSRTVGMRSLAERL